MTSKTKLAVLVTIIVIVVAAAVALSYGTFDKKDSDKDNGHAFPDPIEESDRDYPTASAAEESYAKTIETLKSSLSDSSLSVDDMTESIEAAAEEFSKIRDYYVWMYLDYSEKPTEMADTYTSWTELAAHLYNDVSTVLKESLSGPCAETVEKAMKACGLDPEEYRNYDEATQADLEFNAKETSLIADYNDLMYGDYEISYGGKTWTLDSIAASTTLSDEQKMELTTMLYEAQYTEAAEIYVELVKIRNDFAVSKGYDNYSTYAYKAIYGRDYTPTEAKAFISLTGTMYDAYVDVLRASYFDESMSPSKYAWMDGLAGYEFIEAVTPFIDSMGDEYAKLLDYMVEYGLIDICDDAGRKEGSYTVELYTRGSAVTYIGQVGEGYEAPWTVKTVVHEFGHAANFCLNPKYTSCYDVMDIHSQGLEALYCASGLVGEGSSRAMASYVVQNLLWNGAVSGVMTELELWAYETEAETGSLTAEDVTEKFGSLLETYGIHYSEDVDEKYLWVTVSSIFETPHYVISCGTSAIGALELFEQATENYDSAKAKYLDLVFQQGVDGYSEAVKKAGLTNAFDVDAVKAILAECTTALERVKA